MIKCSECPRFKDHDPNKVDYQGNHFGICGMSGNMEPQDTKCLCSQSGETLLGISGAQKRKTR